MRTLECQRRLVRGRAGMASPSSHADGDVTPQESLSGLALQASFHIGLLSGVETSWVLRVESIPRHGECLGCY